MSGHDGIARSGFIGVPIEQGAVEEVRDLLARGLDPTLPAMKAIGVREIGDWLAGSIDRDTMVERAVIATRQYAKRQRTWFRSEPYWRWLLPDQMAQPNEFARELERTLSNQ